MANNNRKRGFTLVELIVVLVILAVLAALLIPALTGYIDKAKKSQVIAETRALTQAAQTELSSLYGSNEFSAQRGSTMFTVAAKDDSVLPNQGGVQKLTGLKNRYDAIVSLSEVPSLTNGTGSFCIIADQSCKIQFAIYVDGKGEVGVYCAEDGSMTAYKDGSEVQSGNLGTYKDRVICTKMDDSRKGETWSVWSKAYVYAWLGIQS